VNQSRAGLYVHRVGICLLLALCPLILGEERTDSDVSAKQLSAAYNDFGFRLLAELEKNESSRNIFFSPPSLAMTLALAAHGADGPTREAMNRVLGISRMSREESADANRSLVGYLNLPSGEATLNMANSVWCRSGVTLEQEFIDSAWTSWRAKAASIDFDQPSAVKEINAWVSSQTRGAIPRMMNGPIDRDVGMILANAIYFRGPWEHRFDTNRTRNLPFRLREGDPIDHPTMFLENTRLQYFNPGGFQAVGLPYSRGPISMYVFLPSSKSSITNFMRAVNRNNWSSWMLGFQSTRGTLGLPRFRADYDRTLNNSLAALGMGIAFTPKADFSRMSREPHWIGQVVHKALVEVNEEGTTAAAATTELMARVGIEPRRDPFEMIVDRPFFFAIVDSRNGLVLFLGKIVNPAKN
jgi:serine protease inhibitor